MRIVFPHDNLYFDPKQSIVNVIPCILCVTGWSNPSVVYPLRDECNSKLLIGWFVCVTHSCYMYFLFYQYNSSMNNCVVNIFLVENNSCVHMEIQIPLTSRSHITVLLWLLSVGVAVRVSCSYSQLKQPCSTGSCRVPSACPLQLLQHVVASDRLHTHCCQPSITHYDTTFCLVLVCWTYPVKHSWPNSKFTKPILVFNFMPTLKSQFSMYVWKVSPVTQRLHNSYY